MRFVHVKMSYALKITERLSGWYLTMSMISTPLESAEQKKKTYLHFFEKRVDARKVDIHRSRSY